MTLVGQLQLVPRCDAAADVQLVTIPRAPMSRLYCLWLCRTGQCADKISPFPECSRPLTIGMPAARSAPSRRHPHLATSNQVYRYAKYRLAAEWAALAQRSPTAAYLQRAAWWWRYTFPQYIDPAGLPSPPDYPPPSAREPPWTVPAAHFARMVPVWEHQASNVLLFGHTMPTTPEVRYRAAYLKWCELREHCKVQCCEVAKRWLLCMCRLMP